MVPNKKYGLRGYKGNSHFISNVCPGILWPWENGAGSKASWTPTRKGLSFRQNRVGQNLRTEMYTMWSLIDYGFIALSTLPLLLIPQMFCKAF